MANETKAPAEKKIIINDLNEAIGKLDNADAVKAAVAAGLVKAEIDTVDVESGKFSGDYVRLSLGEAVTDDSTALAAITVICGGKVIVPDSKDDKGNAVDNSRKASVVKFALYGADLANRSRVSQQIKSAAQGPEKKIEQMAKLLKSQKPELSDEQALDLVRMMLQ